MRTSVKLIIVFMLGVFIATPLAVIAAEDDDGVGSAIRDIAEYSVLARVDNYLKAVARWPIPTNLSNYPLRQALVKFTERQDQVNHPWYVYILSNTGQPVGYYVGQTYPQSACNFLSPSEAQVDSDHDGDNAADFVMTAPSLDGVYYGGGGASSACETMFMFDAVTDAMITFAAENWLASDQPLSIETEALGTATIENVPPAAPAP